MSDSQQFWLRLTYIERDRLAMLSHLEVVHAIERTIRRAQLPFAVSQGFSPHMIKSFGPALPVGVGSTCEIFDVRLTRYVPVERALAALQEKSAPDLMIVSCAYRDPKAPAAAVAFPLATYEARLSRPVCGLPYPSDIQVVRKKKTKTLHVDDFLRGGFRLVNEATGEELANDAAGGAAAAGQGVPRSSLVRFTLESFPSGSLRPDVLLKACFDLANAEDAAHASDGEGRAEAGGEPCMPLRAVSVTRTLQEAAR